MSNSDKSKMLSLVKILMENTDKNNKLFMREILTLMEEEGHDCSDDTIRRYMKQIGNEYKDDIEIKSTRGRNAQYYINKRLFTNAEMKLIVDAINASNFIEKSVATNMIDKLKKIMSKYEAEELNRSTLGITIPKTENKKILDNIDKIQDALKKNVQISFDYMCWNKDGKLEKKSKYRHTLNPWALLWANDRYYLYGYDTKEMNGKFAEKHYRVDKISGVELNEIPRGGAKQYQEFHADTYVSKRIGMFTGKEESIVVRFPDDLLGVFIDQFGAGRFTFIEKKDGMQTIRINVVVSKLFLGWLIGLQEVEIVEPIEARQKMIKLLESNKKIYFKDN